MKRKIILSLIALLSAGVGVILTEPLFSNRALTQNQSDKSLSVGRSLTGASQEDVGQVAVDYTLANSGEFPVLSGTPKAVLTRPVTAAELPSTGLGEISFIGEEPPLMLVVVKGNFDITNFVPPRQEGPPPRTQTKYIAYVFDLRAGIPTLTATGLTGEYFRRVLNDSSLPDEPKKPPGFEPGKLEPITETRQQLGKKLPYGTELPSRPSPKKPDPPQP